MGEFGQGVGLVHKLGELGAAEELLDGGHHGPDVDELAGRGLVWVGDSHAFADDPLHAQQADAELVLDELPDGAHAPVSQVVDVVRFAAAVVEMDDLSHDRDEVIGHEDTVLDGEVVGEALVHFVAPHLA